MMDRSSIEKKREKNGAEINRLVFLTKKSMK
jgi:hypothetical protein